ncbi:hypothetical protein OBBRIDRAFT_794542 [Obba rivulosa]|uniref:Inactive metallocarboxypeptidase ECM14 n=1 Tax=Obba rivulosa TaxID=1052685 RepID=A0A8E2B108_9APHY|nr:hypothetical protein OBBRIDRAFT_794542 [Obba rivulosa]
MLRLWALTISLLQSCLVRALYAAPAEQEPLESVAGGLLKRFTIDSSFGWDLDQILHIAEDANLDVWNVGSSHVDVYFPSHSEYLSSAFSSINVPNETTSVTKSAILSVPNIAGTQWNLSSLANTTYHSVYHPLYEIESFMRELESLYPDIVQLSYIGHSAEGREMIGMKISKGVSIRRNAKSQAGVVVVGAQHAREWIATSTALYIAHALVSDASEPYAMSSLLDTYDFYLIPVPNPDGYVYTWETDRFWYKNRQILGPNEKCTGLDMNRNWGHKWKAKARFPELDSDTRSSPLDAPSGGTDPCTHWYPGHRPFESPEVNNIANYITTLPGLRAYIDLRSYGQMISTPFSYSCKKVPKDAEDQIEAALGAIRAIKQTHGTAFTTDRLCRSLYKAGGNVIDWMYAKAGIKYAYSVHLRDTGTYGFSLPPSWIRPVGEETANMIRFIAGFIRGKPL